MTSKQFLTEAEVTPEYILGFSWCKSQLPWLRERTIFLTRHGSHAYGTSQPTSDLDLKGIAIPPLEYFLSSSLNFEQSITEQPLDVTILGIQKFWKLASDCNPNIIEILFTDPSDWVLVHLIWEYIIKHRHLFVTQRARHTFSGYAFNQLKRLSSHRGWLLNPPSHKPTRAEFGLPEGSTLEKSQFGVIEAKIRKMLDQLGGEGFAKDEIDTAEESLVQLALKELDLSMNLMPVITAERKYNAAMRTWHQYLKHQEERNEARSELEQKFGYDTKHAMHLVRLMRMAEEILTTGQVNVKRPDAEELLAIRRGAWTYEQLIGWAGEMEVKLKELSEASKLPREPDRVALDKLFMNVTHYYLQGEFKSRSVITL